MAGSVAAGGPGNRDEGAQIGAAGRAAAWHGRAWGRGTPASRRRRTPVARPPGPGLWARSRGCACRIPASWHPQASGGAGGLRPGQLSRDLAPRPRGRGQGWWINASKQARCTAALGTQTGGPSVPAAPARRESCRRRCVLRRRSATSCAVRQGGASVAPRPRACPCPGAPRRRASGGAPGPPHARTGARPARKACAQAPPRPRPRRLPARRHRWRTNARCTTPRPGPNDGPGCAYVE